MNEYNKEEKKNNELNQNVTNKEWTENKVN